MAKAKRTAQKSSRSADKTDVYIGSRIRARRLELDITQEELGQKLGVSFQQIQKYEKGVNRVGAARLQAMCDVLHVPMGYFFEGLKKSGKGEAVVTAMDLFVQDALAMRVVKSFPMLTTGSKRTVVRLIEQLLRTDDGR